ncbi:Rv3654c family TadE-like protein [Mycobacterium sp. DL592]|uniref:Rv3654c family TadE-like protein n=1 Tax=Mycobacterium sp. DL592 TaxID=2675524 RepID=UPI001422654E|nr:Rv3654c family TadE-like protein [Mycobacterium sp. DL592]
MRWRRPNPIADDAGAATVLGALLIVVLVTITLAGVQLGGAVVARHRAQAAADLAALAAAAALPGGTAAACRQALGVTAAMGAVLQGCDVDRLDVVLTVSFGRARAVARGGPAI